MSNIFVKKLSDSLEKIDLKDVLKSYKEIVEKYNHAGGIYIRKLNMMIKFAKSKIIFSKARDRQKESAKRLCKNL